MNATQAIDSIVKLLGLSFKKESFKSVFLVDGTEVTNNQESEIEVGQTLYHYARQQYQLHLEGHTLSSQ